GRNEAQRKAEIVGGERRGREGQRQLGHRGRLLHEFRQERIGQVLEKDREEEDRLDHDQRGLFADARVRRDVGGRVRRPQALHRARHLEEQAGQEARGDEQGREVADAALHPLVDDHGGHGGAQAAARRGGGGGGGGGFLCAGVGAPHLVHHGRGGGRSASTLGV